MTRNRILLGEYRFTDSLYIVEKHYPELDYRLFTKQDPHIASMLETVVHEFLHMLGFEHPEIKRFMTICYGSLTRFYFFDEGDIDIKIKVWYHGETRWMRERKNGNSF